MIVIVHALQSYDAVTRYEIEYEGDIDVVTPRFVRKMVRDANLKGKGFIIMIGSAVIYATRVKEGFAVRYLTPQP